MVQLCHKNLQQLAQFLKTDAKNTFLHKRIPQYLLLPRIHRRDSMGMQEGWEWQQQWAWELCVGEHQMCQMSGSVVYSTAVLVCAPSCSCQPVHL
jgi:hypothetical protein